VRILVQPFSWYATATISDLQGTLKRLEQAHIEVKGVLLNGQLQRITSYYGYGYGYKYGGYKQSTKQDKPL
jgi:Mrp family chromosome partitioning ATPase